MPLETIGEDSLLPAVAQPFGAYWASGSRMMVGLRELNGRCMYHLTNLASESISALFKTNFRTDYPFDPIELLMFSFIGATCGLAGAVYIKFHREIVQFFRRHERLSGFLQKK